MISQNPYLFQREYTKGDYTNKVVVGLDLNVGEKVITVGEAFKDGDELTDFYSGKNVKVNKGTVNYRFRV